MVGTALARKRQDQQSADRIDLLCFQLALKENGWIRGGVIQPGKHGKLFYNSFSKEYFIHKL